LHACCRPEVGDVVVLTHNAASQNVNNVLKLGVSRSTCVTLSVHTDTELKRPVDGTQVLQPQETGIVVDHDPDSTRMHFEIKNNTKGSETYGKKA
jgi:hypothetical protein